MELVKFEKNEILVAEETINSIKEFERMKVKVELIEKQLKKELKEELEKRNITSWSSPDGSIKATIKDGYTRKGIDTTRLKKELPDIIQDYETETKVSSSLVLKVEC